MVNTSSANDSDNNPISADLEIANGVVAFGSQRKGYHCIAGLYAGGWSGGTYTGSFSPSKEYTKKILLGDNGAGQIWDRLFALNATQVMSDRRAKKDIAPLGSKTNIATMAMQSRSAQIDQTDIHSELFDRLRPVQYRLIEGDGRLCYGFVAQDVVTAMKELGIREDELDLVHHDQRVTENGYNDSYGMVYSNFIALITHELQKEKMRRSDLELKVESLINELDLMRENISEIQSKITGGQ